MFKFNRSLYPMFFSAPDDGGGGGDTDDKTTIKFTPEQQSVIDGIVGKRVGEASTKAKQTALQELFTKYGVDTEEALADLLKKAKDADDEKKTELEKLQGKVTTAEKKAKDTEETSAAEIKKIKARLLKAEVEREAAKQGVDSTMLAHVVKLLDTSKITEKATDDDFVFEGIEDAVKALVKATPLLVGKGQQSKGSPNLEKKPNSGGNESTQERTPIIGSL